MFMLKLVKNICKPNKALNDHLAITFPTALKRHPAISAFHHFPLAISYHPIHLR
jgi:hypothetical protein